MGVDTYVWLKVRDRAVLDEALDAWVAKERQWWIDEGRENEWDEMVAEGDARRPSFDVQDDGSVSFFTGHRFRDPDLAFTIRCYLHDLFGDRLPRIHDDPRGVFVTPDVCEPRARTYEGVIEELRREGRFIDPAPPTQAEHDERSRAQDAYSKALDAVNAAELAGDPVALEKALAAAPQALRDGYAREKEMMRRVRGEPEPAALDMEHPDLSEKELAALGNVLQKVMGIPLEGELTNDKLADLFAKMPPPKKR